jgi:hypothetical protein
MPPRVESLPLSGYAHPYGSRLVDRISIVDQLVGAGRPMVVVVGKRPLAGNPVVDAGPQPTPAERPRATAPLVRRTVMLDSEVAGQNVEALHDPHSPSR